ncbi:MAG: hypothetical protein M1470_12590 [Bacteroidetes bacterium]|nr:hypothetical protein [Bacteroidota bacterium]MCL5738002.1 hypothetical protein [Bacteroidota bacterium]
MNIGAGEALKIGVGRSLKNWRLALLVYTVNFLFAAVLALPIAAIFTKDVSRSLVGADLLKGFSYRWYVEFVHANSAFFASLFPQIVLIFSVYILVEIFFAGGFYSAFSSKERIKLKNFFAKGSSFFFPLFFVTLVEVALLVLLYIGNVLWVSVRQTDGGLVDYFVLRAELWRYGIVAVLFIVVNLLSDFIRAAVVIDDEGFWSKFGNGFIFAVRHPFSALGVYLGGTLISAIPIAAFFFFRFHEHPAAEFGIFIEIVVSQFIILFRIFSKLIFYAGEATLYKENQIEVIRVKPEMLE